MQLLFTLSILLTPMFLGAVNLNQMIILKKNGSGTIRVVYTEKETLLKEKNFVIGQFPFSKEKIEEYFKSPSSKIFRSDIGISKNDNTLIEVTVVIHFSDFSKLSEMKSFSNIRTGLSQSDSGNIFRNVFTTDFLKNNTIDQIYCTLNSDNKIKSSNGKIDDKEVVWFRGKGYIDVNKDIQFIATFESDVKTSSKETEGDGKSCGLFGMELPLILLSGLVISLRMKKNKS